jgi:hypothetical protein
MADVLANLKTGNLEEVPDSDAALKAGTHGIPVHSPQGDPRIAMNDQEAAQLLSQGYTQPNPDQLDAGLNKAKVNTIGEKALTGLEGVGEGAGTVYTGMPVTTAAEIELGKLLGIKELSPEYINLRHKYNPGWNAAGNVVGAGAATYFGGEATLPFTLPKVAEAGLAKAFGSQLSRVGSIAARNMVQGALFSGSQELGKFMYDPSQTVEKAIGNTTLNSAIAGAAGVAIGSVPPLWNKSRDAVLSTKYLKGLKDSINASPTGQSAVDQLADAGISGVSPDAAVAATSQNPVVRNFSASLTNQRESSSIAARAHTDNINLLKGKIHDNALTSLGTDPQALPAIQNAGDSEVATPLRAGVLQTGKNLYNAQAQAWQKVDPLLEGTVVPAEARASFADRVSGVKDVYAKTPETSPEFGVIAKAMGDLPNLETLQDYQKWSSRAQRLLWGEGPVPKYPEAYNNLHAAVADWTDQYKLTALSSIAPDAVPLLQEAKDATKNMYGFMRNTSQALKIGEPGHNPAEWLSRLENPLVLTDGQLLSKTTPADNDAFIDWIQGNAPDAVEAAKNAYRQKIIQQASNNKDGVFDPAKAWKIIKNQWSPKTQNFVMADLPNYARNMDLLNQIPTSNSPSGPFIANAMKNWVGGMGAFVGHVIGGPVGGAPGGWILGRLGTMLGSESVDAMKLSALKFAETGAINAPAFKAMHDFFAHASTAQTVMDSAISQLLKGTPGAPIKQIQPDPKGAAKLHETLQGYNETPETMLGVGGNLSTYLPEHHMALAGVLGRAQQYLKQLQPSTEPLGPLDNPRVPTKMQEAQYARALNLVNKPLSILENIRKGNVSTDDLAVMEGVYPGLYSHMKEKLTHAMLEHKAKGKNIPYQQRLALSQFLGVNLDSTIGPMAMMTLMQSKQQGGQPQQGQGGRGGPKKASQATYSRMQEGANSMQTPNQASERDKVNPQ